MNTSTANFTSPKQAASFRRWLLAFFAPTYAFVLAFVIMMILMAVGFPEVHAAVDFLLEHEADLSVALFVSVGIANVLGLCFCLREVSHVQNSVWQRALLAVATVFGLATQSIVLGLYFGANWIYYR